MQLEAPEAEAHGGKEDQRQQDPKEREIEVQGKDLGWTSF